MRPAEDNSDLKPTAFEDSIENSNHQEPFLPPKHYFVDVMLNCEYDISSVAKSPDGEISVVKPYNGAGLGEMMVL